MAPLVILYLYAQASIVESVRRTMLGALGPKLRTATADALNLEANQVVVLLLEAWGENADPLLIVGQASDVGANSERLALWLRGLSRAWVDFVGPNVSGWKKEVVIQVRLSSQLQCSTQT